MNLPGRWKSEIDRGGPATSFEVVNYNVLATTSLGRDDEAGQPRRHPQQFVKLLRSFGGEG